MSLMKNSGIKWIGMIPKSWRISRFKYIYSTQKARLPKTFWEENDNGSLSQYMTMEYIRDKTATTQYSRDGTYCKKEDLLLLWDGSNAGEIIYKHPEGYAPSTTAILSPITKINPIYGQFYLKFLEQKIKESTNGMGIPHVENNFLQTLPFLIPPLSIQQSIADFLDSKCAEIDSLSADIEKQIKILEKYKKSFVTEAVTKGLTPDVEMKDSGIEWIGMVPENWDIYKLKYCLERNDGGIWGNDATGTEKDKIVLRSTEQTIDGNWDIANPARRAIRTNCEQYKIIEGDLLVTKSSGSELHIGKTTIANNYFNRNKCYYSNFLQRLRTNDRLLPKFLWYLMNNPIVKEQFVLMQNSTIGIKNINANDINNIMIALPPCKTQQSIVNFLDNKCSEIDAIITEKKEQLKTLTEYKKSLIYEYVTGKKEVK